MNIQKWFFDRFDQSFGLLRKNFLSLFMPFFLYTLISVVIFGTIISRYFISNLSEVNPENVDFFSFLNDPYIVLGITVGVFLFILYLLLYIPIFLGLIKSLKQAVNEEEIIVLDNLKYGYSRLYTSMKTYWYIFSYIALIPAILFIIGWLLFNFWYYFELPETFFKTGLFFMAAWVILFIVFAIYRWTKATFAMYSAVDKDSFSKENFENTISITIDNWWRIFWNILLLSILVSIIASLIGSIIWIFTFFLNSSSIDYMWLINQVQLWTMNQEEIKNSINNMFASQSVVLDIFKKCIDAIISSMAAVYTIIFTYLLFKRLELESKWSDTKDLNNNISL